MNEEILKTIKNLESAFDRISKKDSVIYFLTYDTKSNPRASVKYIYDFAKRLIELGYKAKILVEDKTYTGVSDWLGDRYNDIPVISIKDDKPYINVDDFIIVPEYYSNILSQLQNIKCAKIMLVQQKEYIFDTLNIGNKWEDFGFDKCITTTQESKLYIDEYFHNTLTYVIPPYIEDIFKPSDKPQKPYVAISCRDRIKTKKIISEFYLRYPHLRWITFRDMVQLNYDEFAEALSECIVSVWVDNESTFGTFPIESMKSNVPVIGKTPETKPEWISDNGMWVTKEDEINDMIASYILSWIYNSELYNDFEEKMKETASRYDKNTFNENVKSIFETIYENRVEMFNKSINNLKNKEE